EENIEETLSFYRLPRQHHKHLKSTNMLERLNQEIKRRTHVVQIFPTGAEGLNTTPAKADSIGRSLAFAGTRRRLDGTCLAGNEPQRETLSGNDLRDRSANHV